MPSYSEKRTEIETVSSNWTISIPHCRHRLVPAKDENLHSIHVGNDGQVFKAHVFSLDSKMTAATVTSIFIIS